MLCVIIIIIVIERLGFDPIFRTIDSWICRGGHVAQVIADRYPSAADLAHMLFQGSLAPPDEENKCNHKQSHGNPIPAPIFVAFDDGCDWLICDETGEEGVAGAGELESEDCRAAVAED